MFGIDWDRLTSGNAKRLPIKDTGAQRLYVHMGINASQGYLSAQIWRRQKHPFPIHPRCNCSLKAENRQEATESSGAIHEHTCDRIVHFNSARHNELAEYTEERHRWNRTIAIAIAIAMLALSFTAVTAFAQVNGVGRRPYLGWSTFSEQTIVPSSMVMNEQNILAQSDAMRSTGLQAHGFRYINLDAGWSGDSDQYGRTLWNMTAFPHFLEMIQHIHANRQKVGIYLLPGIGTSVVSANLPILGTPYHAQDIVAMPAHDRQRIWLWLQDRFHETGGAGVHQLNHQPLCIVGHRFHQARLGNPRLV